MLHSHRPVTLAAAVLLLGCATEPPTTALIEGNSALGGIAVAEGLAESALGLYEVSLDLANLTATATPLATRSLAANDDVTDLEVSRFLGPDHFRFTAVRETATTVDLEFAFTHPFASPDVALPASAINRADLGAAVRVVFLIDADSAPVASFFQGDQPISCVPGVITNADGFIQPRGLIDFVGNGADTFPYKMLIDEALDNRLGVSNGGSPTGDFDAAQGGWQRLNLLDDGTWTGFGTLHQGQTGINTVSLSKFELGGGSIHVSFKVALLAKYGQAKAVVPQKIPIGGSVTGVKGGFGYRAYHNALDLEAVQFHSESGGFVVDQPSASTLAFLIRDWDARATETIEVNLFDEENPALVAQNESGLPTVAVSIPEVLGPSVIETFDNALDVLDDDTGYHADSDPGPESGVAGDEIVFRRTITKLPVGGQTPGPAYGAIRAIDRQVSQDTTAWHAALTVDGSGLIDPLSTEFPDPVVYQIFEVDLTASNLPPTLTLALNPTTVFSGSALTLEASGANDPDGDDITLEADWLDDGTWTPLGTILAPGYLDAAFPSPVYTNLSGLDQLRTIPVRYFDGTVTITHTPALTFTLEPRCYTTPPPQSGTDRTVMWAMSHPDTIATLGLTNNTAPGDWAAFSDTVYPGFVIPILRQTVPVSHNFFRVTAQPPYSAASAIAMTSGDLGGITTNLTTAQVEVDSQNRVFFTQLGGSWSPCPVFARYPGATNPATNIRYFDYAGAPVATLTGTIDTAGRIPVSLTVGIKDDLYVIDHLHTLHRYTRSGATVYSEDSSAPFPVNLIPIIGQATGTGDANRMVADFVQSFHNKDFFILTVSGATANHARLHRIHCDGTPFGVSTPFTLTGTAAQSRDVDLTLDQWDSNGDVIAEGDVQFLVGGFAEGPAQADLFIFNSGLISTASQDTGTNFLTDSRGRLATSIDNVLLSMRGNGAINLGFHAVPPAGWL